MNENKSNNDKSLNFSKKYERFLQCIFELKFKKRACLTK